MHQISCLVHRQKYRGSATSALPPTVAVDKQRTVGRRGLKACVQVFVYRSSTRHWMYRQRNDVFQLNTVLFLGNNRNSSVEEETLVICFCSLKKNKKGGGESARKGYGEYHLLGLRKFTQKKRFSCEWVFSDNLYGKFALMTLWICWNLIHAEKMRWIYQSVIRTQP